MSVRVDTAGQRLFVLQGLTAGVHSPSFPEHAPHHKKPPVHVPILGRPAFYAEPTPHVTFAWAHGAVRPPDDASTTDVVIPPGDAADAGASVVRPPSSNRLLSVPLPPSLAVWCEAAVVQVVVGKGMVFDVPLEDKVRGMIKSNRAL